MEGAGGEQWHDFYIPFNKAHLGLSRSGRCGHGFFLFQATVVVEKKRRFVVVLFFADRWSKVECNTW
jgi:hypothetical protein